jgi:hypothetical protein
VHWDLIGKDKISLLFFLVILIIYAANNFSHVFSFLGLTDFIDIYQRRLDKFGFSLGNKETATRQQF